MTAQEIYTLVQVLISGASLIVSVIVFINTVNNSEKERKLNSSREMYNAFLGVLDEFNNLTETQMLWDNYAVIYGEDPFDYGDKFSQISYNSAKIHALSQKAVLYMSENCKLSECIKKMIELIEKRAISVNKSFCEDLNLLHDGKEDDIDIKGIEQKLRDYSDCFKKVNEQIYVALHALQRFIFSNKKYSDECINVCESILQTYDI